MISFLDSTMLDTYKRCPREFYFSFVLNLSPLEKNWHLHSGGAMSKALEVARKAYLEGDQNWKELGLKTLIEAYGPDDSPIPAKGLDRFMMAYARMWDVWPPDKGLRISKVEFTFSFPLDIQAKNGDPLLYTGRCDWIGELNGSLFVVDDKTTSGLGQTWASRWPLRGQLIGYVHAARLYGIPVAGAVVRGIALTAEPTFAETIILFPEWTIKLWLSDVHIWAKRILEDEDFPRHFGENCASCRFKEICTSPNPQLVGFEERNWDPIRR